MKSFGCSTDPVVVNVVPPSTAKRRGSSCSSRKSDDENNSNSSHRQRPNKKKRMKKSLVSSAEKQPPVPLTTFDKLDPTDQIHAKRIQQRRKAISKGKNTAGYDAYLQQVPKQSRRPRSMATPSTPDPTLDISQKRWNGQVRAWRKALHSYDPPDLVGHHSSQTSRASSTSSNHPQEQEPDDDTTTIPMTLESTAVPATPTSSYKRPYVRFYEEDETSSMAPSPQSVQSDHDIDDLEDFAQGVVGGGHGDDDDSDDDLL